MRFGLLVVVGLLIAGGGMSYALYGELHSETVTIEAAPQVIVSPDGAHCEAMVFKLESRRQGELYVRAEEGQFIDGRVGVQGPAERDVIVRVYSPHNRVVLPGRKQHDLDFSIPAVIRGDYLFQFDNRHSILTDKTIEFSYCLR